MQSKDNEIANNLSQRNGIETKIDSDDNNDLLNWIKSTWQVGSVCEVYSNISDCWFEGAIKRTLTDSEGQWFEFEHMDTVMRVSPSSNTIRPYVQAMKVYKYIFDAISNEPKTEARSAYDTSSSYAITDMSAEEWKEMDSSKLCEYLINNVDEFKEYGSDCVVSISKFTTGYVNPPYLLTFGNDKYVLRKGVIPYYDPNTSAEKFILKQYKIMSAIGENTDIPVPKMFHFCYDTSIIGTSFYVMEFVKGRVIKHAGVDLESWTEQDRKEIYYEMLTVIAKIHCVDYEKLGLTEWLKGTFEWSKEGYLNQFNNELVANHKLHKNCDRSKSIALFEKVMKNYKYKANNAKIFVHGDIHFENVIFHPSENKIIAVLDWEFCTVGDAILDLAYFTNIWKLQYSDEMIWRIDEVPGVFRGTRNAMGIPSERDALKIYVNALRAYNAKNIDFYVQHINSDWNFYSALVHYRCVSLFHNTLAESPDSKLAVSFGHDLLDYFAVLGKNVMNRDDIVVDFDLNTH